MKQIPIRLVEKNTPAVIAGCMRFAEKSVKEVAEFVDSALELGVDYFDHADIYGNGKCEELFGEVLNNNSSIDREKIVIQSKCGVRLGIDFDLSKEHILNSVDGILKRLNTDYLDVLLLHRPDALFEPEEIAEALDRLEASGKVKTFGVSNFKPLQIELLKKCVKQELVINQLQFSLPVSNMIAGSMEMNMESPGSIDHDGGVLDYCRLHDMTIQAWSPFQMPAWQGVFLGNDRYADLNKEIDILAEKYGVTPTTIASAWILRHPAKMQIVSGTTSVQRMKEIVDACDVNLTREEWYKLYLSAGHLLP
ncbi:MAG: aldo/keto reductase family oxidoreductase [Lachnospiraceae bacterium]|nr:aldo/keto reductase family oxidoreductase [Lachnospiraceae bacterium]